MITLYLNKLQFIKMQIGNNNNNTFTSNFCSNFCMLRTILMQCYFTAIHFLSRFHNYPNVLKNICATKFSIKHILKSS